MYTDASSIGGGGFFEGEEEIFHCFWTPAESLASSTYRELEVFRRLVTALSPTLRGRNLIWKCDNMNVVGILKRGSMKEDLQLVAKQIFYLKRERGIEISAVWISRSVNRRADAISKIPFPFDWVVSQHIFSYIDSIWGPFTCDAFADGSNSKCRKFYSKFPCPGSFGVNALDYDWGRDKSWVTPPISLIGNTILHMKRCRAYGALVVPRWEASYFWPLLCREDGSFAEFILEFKEYGRPVRFFREGNSKFEGLGANMLILRIDCRK